MADFDKAIDLTFRWEGGYCNVKEDSGGPTNMGITLGTLRDVLGQDLDGDGFADGDLDHDGDIDAEDVKLLTREQARAIYHDRYWGRPGFWAIKDQRIATKAFDAGVNCGPPVAIALLQRAVNDVRPSRLEPLVVDGKLGARTLGALAACDPDLVLKALCAEQAVFYTKILARHPEKERFRKGWMRRAQWAPDGGAP